MTRLFTADYSTGDFSQWTALTQANRPYQELGYEWPHTGAYPAQIVSADCPDAGYAARFEVRSGDVPSGFSSGERCEVISTSGYDLVGTTRWYAFSVKFDSAFPTDHPNDVGWGNVMQWHDHPNGAGSPVLSMGWAASTVSGQSPGYWYLFQSKQSAPLTYVGDALPLVELPMDVGQWQDIKLRVVWKQDDTGTVQLWRNGVRQTFTEAAGGGTTFTGQTVCPPGGGGSPAVTGVMPQQGYYRHIQVGAPTGVVYHRGYRVADSEGSL